MGLRNYDFLTFSDFRQPHLSLCIRTISPCLTFYNKCISYFYIVVAIWWTEAILMSWPNQSHKDSVKNIIPSHFNLNASSMVHEVETSATSTPNVLCILEGASISLYLLTMYFDFYFVTVETETETERDRERETERERERDRETERERDRDRDRQSVCVCVCVCTCVIVLGPLCKEALWA